jgi:uncharacterized LabA/DUF88 family protein
MRVGCYIDGFNLYHAVDALGEPSLKWLDLRSLAMSYVRAEHTLTRVAFFTALNTWDKEKRARHVQYIKALESTEVEVFLASFDRVKKHCRVWDRYCRFDQEKQTDVHLAVQILADCYERAVDRVLLMTADSDHVPLLKMIRNRCPDVRVFLIAPPNRLREARQLGSLAHKVFQLTAGRLRQHPLPIEIRDNDRLIAVRPARYARNR